MAGTGLYWGRGRRRCARWPDELRVPVFLNGLGRGCLPADDELAFSRARSAGLGGADVALVIGVPLDFRLGFGAAFAEDAHVIAIDVAEPLRPHPRAAERRALRGPAGHAGGPARAAPVGGRGADSERASARDGWIASLRATETERRAAEAGELADPRAPLHPMRIYGELAQMLDRDAIVDRRRRRLRLLCRPRGRLLPAGLLA